jgi:hypothetical protein
MHYSNPNRAEFVHIQQPELHLHPKMQAQLADVFIKALHERRLFKLQKLADSKHKAQLIHHADKQIDSDVFFLLESHSEHLLLRLLRRIRESNQVKNQKITESDSVINLHDAKFRTLSSDQISVVYVKKDPNGLTTMQQLRVADDGDFIDRWPDGFFTERDKELFGDEGPFA